MSTIRLSLETARRLAVSCQHLAGPRIGGIVETIQTLRCLQIDPIRAVEVPQRLILWSRLGNYDVDELDHLLWSDRMLFEYWAHAASLVLTKDYPIHQVTMRKLADGGRNARSRAWMAKNQALKSHVLERLAEGGPLPAGAFKDSSEREPSRWNSGRNVNTMLDMLWFEGAVMVAGRKGRTRLWDLPERCLPEWTPLHEFSARRATRVAAEHALRALGLATVRHIREHFIRKRYDGLPAALAELERDGLVMTAQIDHAGELWPETWYIHRDRLALLEKIQAGDWQPRTTLLSPFDNLICDRQRTEQLFEFFYRIEIYVPPAKRQYGYYVLPILHGDRLIGRLDPRMDRKQSRLHILNMYIEPEVSAAGTASAVAGAVRELAAFLGADEIERPGFGHAPEPWRKALS